MEENLLEKEKNVNKKIKKIREGDVYCYYLSRGIDSRVHAGKRLFIVTKIEKDIVSTVTLTTNIGNYSDNKRLYSQLVIRGKMKDVCILADICIQIPKVKLAQKVTHINQELLEEILDKSQKQVMENNDVKDSKETKSEEKTVAISYAWIDEKYRKKIIGFANYLRDRGYKAVMDIILEQQNTSADINEMMSRMISDAKKVIVVLSPKYKQSADRFEGGVGFENRIIIREINRLPNKYIFVTFDSLEKIMPEALLPNALGNREIIEIYGKNKEWEEILFSKLSGKPVYKINKVADTKREPITKTVRLELYENGK
ncbi:MAG: toll/interleukin-1 receptor domain-containing protein [Butyrivibrio sp.]|jgi:hypothetical protein|nr:toll/interleukin-1 receptor domain-containing protein [Butyrivibrio sp.]